MQIRRALGLYLKSRLNITLASVTGGAILLCLLFAPASFALVAPLALLLYVVATAVLLFSGRGASAVSVGEEAERRRRIMARVERFRELRERIGRLRIGDPEMRQAIEYFLLVSGEYLEGCAELVTYSPECNRRIEEVQEVVQIYLKELDESSTERRFQVRDPHDFADYRERTISGIKERALFIKQKALEAFDRLSPEEQLRILEELEEP
jgi:hypothetical protein